MIREGYTKKGGVNKKTPTPRPAPPKGQGVKTIKVVITTLLFLLVLPQMCLAQDRFTFTQIKSGSIDSDTSKYRFHDTERTRIIRDNITGQEYLQTIVHSGSDGSLAITTVKIEKGFKSGR